MGGKGVVKIVVLLYLLFHVIWIILRGLYFCKILYLPQLSGLASLYCQYPRTARKREKRNTAINSGHNICLTANQQSIFILHSNLLKINSF